MSLLTDALPALPDITGNSANPKTPAASSDSGTSIISKAASIAFLGGMSVQSVVFIALGLLLIAAGIFAFKEVRSASVTAVKVGAKAAAAA